MSICRHNHIAGRTYLVSVSCQVVGDGFSDETCYRFYLLRLLNCLNTYRARLHAYCLLSNQVVLLVTPGTYSGVANMLAHLNKSYSRYFNKRFRRSISVWEANTGSWGITENENVLLAQKYVERLPIGRKLVDHGGAYPWSSYCCNSFSTARSFLSPHPAFIHFLSLDHENPFAAYREFIAAEPDPAFDRLLESHLLRNSGLIPRPGTTTQLFSGTKTESNGPSP